MIGMKFNIITFGCKVNSYESEYIKEQMILNNYIFCDDYNNSDIVIVNTCSVTNIADSKCKKVIRSIRRENPNVILAVCGCSSENHREEYKKLDIDILIGNSKKSEIVTFINDYINDNKKYVYFDDEAKNSFENMIVKKYDDLTRAFVKIEDGCNNYCSFCVIPYVRGNIRSKKMDDVLDEVKELVRIGHKEIVLTGINLGAYGRDLKQYDLTDLVRNISSIDGLERIRISSIEMTEINDKFIDELKNNKKICPHLHISLQSGSEKILKLMNRKYSKEEYLENIRKIKNARSDINLTTDVIVGFPSESDDDFMECVDFCREVGFSKIHVFPYAKKEQTLSAKLPNHLSNDIKKDRVKKLMRISDFLENEFYSKFLNKKVNVLIEEHVDGYSVGHTDNYLKIKVNSDLKHNECYDVIIKEIKDGEIFAELDT